MQKVVNELMYYLRTLKLKILQRKYILIMNELWGISNTTGNNKVFY